MESEVVVRRVELIQCCSLLFSSLLGGMMHQDWEVDATELANEDEKSVADRLIALAKAKGADLSKTPQVLLSSLLPLSRD